MILDIIIGMFSQDNSDDYVATHGLNLGKHKVIFL